MGKIFTLSGPRGCGKTAVIHGLIEHGINPIAPLTTRELRPDEKQGRDYRRVSPSEFAEAERLTPMFDVLRLNGVSYGTPKAELEKVIKTQGETRTFNVAAQTALNLRREFGAHVVCFMVLPQSWEDIHRQMRAAGTPEAKILERVNNEPTDLTTLPQFDRIVVNPYGELPQTVQHVAGLIGQLMQAEMGITPPPGTPRKY